jgi:hypothetical protein
MFVVYFDQQMGAFTPFTVQNSFLPLLIDRNLMEKDRKSRKMDKF